ncbi:translation initiation factor IF-2-like [Schistocerca nitens]|uniref:translation initiation factor IF-2-like n=1 Tax=Schistocerca nitens TaxID=7011 RepID=UPI0021188B9A|nr:translation initiation factor IF-2-like [Schistocerca nitens]
MPLFLVVCSDTVEKRKLYQLTRVADVPVQTEDLRSRRGVEACHRSPTWPNTRATSEEASKETAAASGAPSAVPPASAAPAPAASEAVPTPEAPAPPPQLLVAEPGAASPGTSAGLRPANRRRGGRHPVGTQHRQSSSPRSTLTAKQPRLPLPATGPCLLPPPLTWPASSCSSLSW